MLIQQGGQWPPPGHQAIRERWQSWAAWWSGDLARLRMHTPRTAPGGYWAKRATQANGRQMHLPLAADIARTSAELVAGDTPALDWGDDTIGAEWDDLSQTIGWSNTLLEGLETCAALGGCYLRPAWDTTLAAHPLSTVVGADEALPVFKFGMLQSVTFVTELPVPDGWLRHPNGDVLRHLEHHEPGQIRHELWYGSTTVVGKPVPLAEHPTTAGLPDTIDTTSIRPGLLVDYIPNDLPQPLVPGLPLGRADIQGCEPLLDALDESWDSWMRDIRLGKARILAPAEFLEPVPATAGERPGFLSRFGRKDTTAAKQFDTDAEVFSPMPGMTPEDQTGKAAPITVVEFKLRVAEHQQTCAELVEQITARAGYAPQTMGMHVDGQLSGTAMRRREQRSHRTKDRKRRYARPPIERHAETLMVLHSRLFGGPQPTARPSLAWRETEQADPTETAQTIELLRRAEALSTETAVRMSHPEWDEQQVEQEVARILAERPVAPAATGFEPTTTEGAPL